MEAWRRWKHDGGPEDGGVMEGTGWRSPAPEITVTQEPVMAAAVALAAELKRRNPRGSELGL
jgi:hypothetical protein